MTLGPINLVLVAIKILHGFKQQIYASITELGSWLTNSRIPLIPRIPIDGIASVMDRNRRLGPNHGSRSTGALESIESDFWEHCLTSSPNCFTYAITTLCSTGRDPGGKRLDSNHLSYHECSGNVAIQVKNISNP